MGPRYSQPAADEIAMLEANHAAWMKKAYATRLPAAAQAVTLAALFISTLENAEVDVIVML